MDKDRIKGKIEEVTGSVKRQVGEATGNKKTEAEGIAEQAKGKVREAVGKAKDSVRDAADELRRRKENEQEIDREPRDEEEVA